MAFPFRLRWYQEELDRAARNFITSNSSIAQIYSPTGSGKTVCFSKLIHDLPTLLNTTERLNIAIVHPRIALSQDQLARFKSTYGDKYRYTSFHSGAHVRGTEQVQEISTTDRSELEAILSNSKRHHITFSSYDSFKKLVDIEFDLVIFDEAHNLTKKEFLPVLQELKAKKALLYTATPIIRKMYDDEKGQTFIGMDNFDLFGEVIVSVEPKSLILDGYVVPPLIHFLRTHTDGEGVVDPVDIIAESFKYQNNEMKKYGMPYTQMLVAARGLEDLRVVEERLVELWEAIGEMVPVYCVEHGSSRLNGREQGDRAKLLNMVKNSNSNAIVIHYDTLSEGIDIDSLTGVCFLRKMAKAKILQTIGRCGRPFISDLDENYEVIDMNNRKKPVCVVTLPVVNGEHIGGMDTKKIADAFIDGGYGDLSTYLEDMDQKTMSEKSEDKDDWDESKEDTVLRRIVDSQLERDGERLAKLGILF